MAKDKNVTGEEILDICSAYMSADDLKLVEKAWHYATDAHSGQFRQSGEPYIIHPIQVAGILADLHLDAVTVACGFLHDVVEDTEKTLDDLEADFGTDVRNIVDGVTKLGKVEYKSHEEQLAENHRKMLMAMSKDIRVILVKLADRLHNMRTLKHLRKDKQERISRETMEIYAPLAHRLGISRIKWELEDMSFRYLNEVEFYKISHMMKEKRREREELVDEIVDKIKTYTAEQGLVGDVYGRPKHIYSIYRKMRDKKKRFDQIYDLIAIRCVMETHSDVYAMLGYIHELWRPMPGRFKDYIANPKSNGYQSIHTTVYGPKGPIEIQIRTKEMHQVAEYGVAAHWAYKKGIKGKVDSKESALGMNWIKDLVELQDASNGDAMGFVDSVKEDIFSERIYVFTPNGAVQELPKDSGPIDFAYAIHSGVGNAMVGAKVNNRIASYDQQLCNGDIVEVLTSKTAKGPSRDWLNICKSNGARTKIKQWFKKEKREENIVHGKASFEGEMRRANVNPAVLQDAELLPGLLKKLAFECLDDMYAAIGYGGLTAAKAFGRIRDDLIRATRQTPAPPVREVQKQAEPGKGGRHKDSGVIVEDIDSCMIKFSRCCTPVPGDDIVGFITKGYGVSIHRRDCRNAAGASDPKQAGRWVKVAWSTEDKPFSTTFEIDSTDRSGIWLDIATALSAAKLKVTELSGRDMPTGKARTVATFEVRNVQELETIRTKIRAIDGVIDVRRGQN